ncbi:hypothetical protein D3C79_1053060 [compost metagenome]
MGVLARLLEQRHDRVAGAREQRVEHEFRRQLGVELAAGLGFGDPDAQAVAQRDQPVHVGIVRLQ